MCPRRSGNSAIPSCFIAAGPCLFPIYCRLTTDIVCLFDANIILSRRMSFLPLCSAPSNVLFLALVQSEFASPVSIYGEFPSVNHIAIGAVSLDLDLIVCCTRAMHALYSYLSACGFRLLASTLRFAETQHPAEMPWLGQVAIRKDGDRMFVLPRHSNMCVASPRWWNALAVDGRVKSADDRR